MIVEFTKIGKVLIDINLEDIINELKKNFKHVVIANSDEELISKTKAAVGGRPKLRSSNENSI